MTTEPRPPWHGRGDKWGRRRPSWLVIAYGVIGALSIAGALVAGLVGWVPSQAERATVPSSARQAPGGYRTFHFWHSGYQGGK